MISGVAVLIGSRVISGEGDSSTVGVGVGGADHHEGFGQVIVFEKRLHLFEVAVDLSIDAGEDAARKIAAHRNEVECLFEVGLQVLKALLYFRQVLVAESFVN